MIIDSHAHYYHRSFQGEFQYLEGRDDGFRIREGDLEGLVAEMDRQGIRLWIEPSIELERIDAQMALAQRFGNRVRLALGVHPQHCTMENWQQRHRLEEYIARTPIVAIGETGFDFHRDPSQWDGEAQKLWFEYQIGLAHELGLPLVLHIRQAHQEAMALLCQHRSMLHGGVAHCFGGDHREAMDLVDLGFTLGIGGRLLQNEPALADAVARVPLEALLVETDAPYVLPSAGLKKKEKNKIRNSSLILPSVLNEIARLRDMDAETVKKAVLENTCRVFRLTEGDLQWN